MPKHEKVRGPQGFEPVSAIGTAINKKSPIGGEVHVDSLSWKKHGYGKDFFSKIKCHFQT